MLQSDELICDTVAQAILGDGYDASCNYYLYMDMSEISVRAVSRDSGREAWTESRRIDVPDALVLKEDKIAPKYYGHWFSEEVISNRPWVLRSLLICLLAIVAVLICFLMKGGWSVWVT